MGCVLAGCRGDFKDAQICALVLPLTQLRDRLKMESDSRMLPQ
jgi:hypothetical protein